MYNVYKLNDMNEFQYIEEFVGMDAAIEFASKRHDNCVVTEHRSFCDNNIIFKNY